MKFNGFEDSIIDVIIAVFTLFYALNLFFIFKDWTLKRHNSGRRRILRWFGRENEENVIRTKD